jgi:hypothetical protein
MNTMLNKLKKLSGEQFAKAMRIFTPERKTKWRENLRSLWQQLKDFLLVLFLLNMLIGLVQQLHFNWNGAVASATAYDKPNEVQKETLIKVSEGVGEESSSPSASTLADKIYILESSGGKNDSCLAKGKVNGYGFGQHKNGWACYDSHEEVEKLVIDWIEDKREKGMTDEELLCYYNEGNKISKCDYLDKFNKLK